MGVKTTNDSHPLSTTEVDYIAIFQSLRDVFLIMSLIKELRSRVFPVVDDGEAKFLCKIFEDNFLGWWN